MSYPSHITNIYELLNEDGEPQTARANTGGDQSKSSNAPRSQTSSTRGNAQGGAKPQGARDGQRRTNENRPPRQDNRAPRSIDGRKPNEVPVGGDFSQAAPVRRERGDRTRDSAHRATERKVRGADQVGEFGGKRVFDRRSGTGRGREQKKAGAGRGNWGKEGEGEAQEGSWDTEENKGEQKEGEPKVEEVPEQKTPEQEERERLAKEEQEKEDALITLDTYLKQKEAAAPKVELPQARKANEGVDQKELSKWGGYAVLKKDDDDDEIVSKKESKEKSGKNTVPVDQVFNVREQPRPRPEREDRGDRGDRGDRPFRGGRGGNRGGSRGGNRGGRGGSRGGSSRGESAPNFDLNSFPTLAPKA